MAFARSCGTSLVCLAGLAMGHDVVRAADTPLYGIFEQSFTHAHDAGGNPYTSIAASVTLTAPDGQPRKAQLFWDGGSTWKLRFSPDKTGAWTYSVVSSDAGLNGSSGSFSVVPSKNHGGIQAMPGHPYAFQYQDGTPFYFMGDTAWSYYTNDAAERHDRAAARHYVDVRASQGFNVVHSMLLNEFGWDNDGGKPFNSFDAETINPAYFQEVDQRVAYLNDKGITAGILLAFAKSTHSRDGYDWQKLTSPARNRFAQYVAARYGAYNAYFVVTGEWQEALTPAEFNVLGTTISTTDPHRRMIAMHAGGEMSSEAFADQPWVNFGDYQQIYTHLHKAILTARDHEKPVVNSEYAYYLRDQDSDGVVDKPNSATLKQIRDASWDIAMAGGYMITGFGTTYLGGARDPGPFDVDVAKNDDWEEDATILMNFFRDRKFWKLEPHDELISDGGNGTRYALAASGEEYVAYVRNGAGDITLSLGPNVAAATYRLQRFNPRTGEYTKLGEHAGSTSVTFAVPDADDWLFVASVADKREDRAK